MAFAEFQINASDISRPLDKSQAQLEEKKMVQVFMVVRCYSCKAFQVHQVKKINKWMCKICNEKQSVLKTYGKGSGKECRKHAQKLNMLRAERDKERDEVVKKRISEVAGKDMSSKRRTEVVENHPPDDYAHTFTARDSGMIDSIDMIQHPVILAGTKKSKWTTFIKPEDEDEDEIKLSKERGGSLSARGPHLQVSILNAQEDNVCPYSIVNQELDDDDDDSRLTTSKSAYFHPDRYTKLDNTIHPSLYSDRTPNTSHSMLDLSSLPAGQKVNHKERMMQIKQDLKQFSNTTPPQKAVTKEQKVPILSLRWSQFMHEEDDSGEEGEDVTTHLLASKFTVSKSTL